MLSFEHLLAALPTMALLLAVAALGALWRRRRRARLEATLAAGFGARPRGEGAELSHLRAYHEGYLRAHPSPRRIDDISWSDLNMDDVFRRINACSCSVGEDWLYHALHELESGPDALIARERLFRWLDEHPAQRIGLQKILLGIGKRNGHGLSGFLFRPEARGLERGWVYALLAAMPLASAAVALWAPVAGLVALGASVCVNVVVYSINRLRIEPLLESMRYFSALRYGAKRIHKRYGEALGALGLDLGGALKPFRGGGFVSGSAQGALMELEALVMLVKSVFLLDFVLYNRTLGLMARHLPELNALWSAVGLVDAAISVASFRRSLPGYCLPEFIEENAIRCEQAYHPLLAAPVKNSASIANDSLVTGSNASGKSTFIKMLAVNGILAQTIHTCCAERYQLGFVHIATSMALRDDILSGESYFVAEIKSIKRIIEGCQRQRCACFIDEILRGTNTPERIAASTAVLRLLHETDSLCVVASHDVELSAILGDDYDNYHFSERFEGDALRFDYWLQEGVCTSTNAIKLLEYMGFDRRIVEDATRLVAQRARG